ncbi:hypothetical protein L3Q82_015635, partial [Scortum barcoo]
SLIPPAAHAAPCAPLMDVKKEKDSGGWAVSEDEEREREGMGRVGEGEVSMVKRRLCGSVGMDLFVRRTLGWLWGRRSTDILDVFNESLASGSMPRSCRRVVLTLLPKKEKSTGQKTGTLCLCSVWITSFCPRPLANRLRGAMEQEPLTVALCKSRTLCLQQLVDAVGPALRDAEALGSLLGLDSVRVAQKILSIWRQRLSGRERSLLMDSSHEGTTPDPTENRLPTSSGGFYMELLQEKQWTKPVLTDGRVRGHAALRRSELRLP